MEENIIDQHELAESISNKINMDFFDCFVVKPMDPIKVKKEFTKLPEKTPTTDKEGVSAIDVTEEDASNTEIKEVDSDFRKGVIIKIPHSYKAMEDMQQAGIPSGLKSGDIVLYRDRAGINFDLLKDSKLLKVYDILAICK